MIVRNKPSVMFYPGSRGEMPCPTGGTCPPEILANYYSDLGATSSGTSFFEEHPVVATIGMASVAASAYHGYKRNDSIGWAIVWALMGGIFPVITPAIAVAQGFGKKK